MRALVGIGVFAGLGSLIVLATWAFCRVAADADRKAEQIIEQRHAEQGGRVNPPTHIDTARGATIRGGQHNGRVG